MRTLGHTRANVLGGAKTEAYRQETTEAVGRATMLWKRYPLGCCVNDIGCGLAATQNTNSLIE